MNEGPRRIFEYYCLGIRNPKMLIGNEYTLDEYLNIVSKLLQERSNFGKRFVVYKQLNKNREIPRNRLPWKSDLRKLQHGYSSVNACVQEYYNVAGVLYSCYVIEGSNKYSYNMSFYNLRANPAYIFLIHPDVKSIDNDEIAEFASIWHTYYFNNIDTACEKQEFIFVIGNRKSIYTGYAPPTREEIEKYKLNLSMIMPIHSLIYEKE